MTSCIDTIDGAIYSTVEEWPFWLCTFIRWVMFWCLFIDDDHFQWWSGVVTLLFIDYSFCDITNYCCDCCSMIPITTVPLMLMTMTIVDDAFDSCDYDAGIVVCCFWWCIPDYDWCGTLTHCWWCLFDWLSGILGWLVMVTVVIFSDTGIVGIQCSHYYWKSTICGMTDITLKENEHDLVWWPWPMVFWYCGIVPLLMVWYSDVVLLLFWWNCWYCWYSVFWWRHCLLVFIDQYLL